MSTNNKPLTKEERNHLAHHYWEDLNHWQGPANTWNCENGIFDYDLFPFIRAWLLETRTFTVTKPKEPWAPPAKDGEAFKARKETLEDGFWGGIRADSYLQAKMIEVELRVRRRLGRKDLFSWIVEIHHLDGSTVIWHNACARIWKSYLLVWTEHNGSHHFHMADLAGWSMFESVAIPRAR